MAICVSARTRVKGAALLMAAAWVALPVQAQERVGVASAVNPAATGQPPGGAVRTLLVGTDVVFNEKIVTSADGQTQILFLDRSAFSVGPNSEIVIDEFVYDPKSGTGKLAASVTKGVFRFVGGALSKNDNAVSIKSPSATIGIRGGMAGFNVEGGQTTVMKIFGSDVTVTTASGSQRIVRNDFYQIVTPQGQFVLPAPGRATAEVRQATSKGLNPLPGANGGASQPPSAGTLAASGYARSNSADLAGARADASARTPVSEPAVINVASLTNSPVIQSSNQISNASGDIFQELVNLLFTSGLDFTHVTPVDSGGSPLSVTDVSQLPLTGTANYTGQLFGAVEVNGVRKVESASTISMTWSFASSSGSFGLNNFGGSNYGGTISSSGGPINTFTGTLSPSSSGFASGVVAGAFYTFSSPADTVAGTFIGGGTSGNGIGFFKGQ